MISGHHYITKSELANMLLKPEMPACPGIHAYKEEIARLNIINEAVALLDAVKEAPVTSIKIGKVVCEFHHLLTNKFITSGRKSQVLEELVAQLEKVENNIQILADIQNQVTEMAKTIVKVCCQGPDYKLLPSTQKYKNLQNEVLNFNCMMEEIKTKQDFSDQNYLLLDLFATGSEIIASGPFKIIQSQASASQERSKMQSTEKKASLKSKTDMVSFFKTACKWEKPTEIIFENVFVPPC